MSERPFEFAPSNETERRAALVEEFVNEVLRLPWALVTDGTTLADFEAVRTELELSEACQEHYGMGLGHLHFQMPLYLLLDELEAARQRRDFPN